MEYDEQDHSEGQFVPNPQVEVTLDEKPKVSRKLGFSTIEDMSVARSFFKASKDPVKCNDMKGGGLFPLCQA